MKNEMETVTIKRTLKGVWMQKFDDYETSFKRISKAYALECIEWAREKGTMFSDDNENEEVNEEIGTYLVFGYSN